MVENFFRKDYFEKIIRAAFNKAVPSNIAENRKGPGGEQPGEMKLPAKKAINQLITSA